MSDDTTSAAADESPAGDDGAAAGSELYGCISVESRGQTVIHPTLDQYLDLVKALADDGYAMVVDLCGVDYLEALDRPLPAAITPERFEVVINLLDITSRRRVRVRLQVPESAPTVPSLFDVYPGTEAYERETFDMFGIEFSDHPDMTRILMPEDWDGHPLRKDYDAGRIPVQFKGAYT